MLKTSIVLLSIILSFTSCRKVLMSMYGIRSEKKLDEREILKYAHRYKIPVKDCYKLDTKFYQFIESIDSMKYKKQMKNHLQPIQVMYYDHQGNLKCFIINCYAQGFPNLKWNKDNIFSTFPPREQAPLDSIVHRDTLLNYLKPLNGAQTFNTEHLEYTVVVFWNRVIGRQCKHLIKYIQANIKLTHIKSVKIIYANNDPS